MSHRELGRILKNKAHQSEQRLSEVSFGESDDSHSDCNNQSKSNIFQCANFKGNDVSQHCCHYAELNHLPIAAHGDQCQVEVLADKSLVPRLLCS